MEVSLYKGKVNISFEPGSHRYKVNGKSGCPSVTSVTGMLNKPALVFWAANLTRDHLLELLQSGEVIGVEHIHEAAKQHTVRKEKAATSGTLVHEWASEYIKGKNPAMPDDENVMRGVTAFLNWVDEHKVKFVASEQIVYSIEHDYVGIMDCKFTLGAEKHKILHAGDFKTSKGIYNEMRYQVAAYQSADAEESGALYGTKWIVRFDKDTGEFEAKEYAEHEEDFKAFLGLLAVKKREQQLKN